MWCISVYVFRFTIFLVSVLAMDGLYSFSSDVIEIQKTRFFKSLCLCVKLACYTKFSECMILYIFI